MIKNKRGFTLIELLVVIAIIAMLMSILMPSLAKVKDLARRIICASNVRQFFVACSVYASSNDGWFPPAGAPDISTGWLFTIPVEPTRKELEKLGMTQDVIFCPSVRKIDKDSFWTNQWPGYEPRTILLYNYLGGQDNRIEGDPPSPRKGRMYPSRTSTARSNAVILADDIIWRDSSPSYWHLNHSKVLQNAEWGTYDMPDPVFEPEKFVRGGNFATCDGAVRWYYARDIDFDVYDLWPYWYHSYAWPKANVIGPTYHYE